MTRSYYLFIVSSVDHPIYRAVHKKKKRVLQKYNVPYTVLLNTAIYDLVIDEDETLFPMDGMNPSMTLKFLHAVRLFFRMYRTWDEVPDYMIRTNATTYIYFPGLVQLLKTLPRNRVLAGLQHDQGFVNGMIMIFSKDVLRNVLRDPRVFSEHILKQPDDVALSKLCEPYCRFYDLSHYFMSEDHRDAEGMYLLNEPQDKKWFFRIRHESSHREPDLKNWDHLLWVYDRLPSSSTTSSLSTPKPLPRSPSYPILLVLFVLLFLYVIGVILFLLLRPSYLYH